MLENISKENVNETESDLNANLTETNVQLAIEAGEASNLNVPSAGLFNGVEISKLTKSQMKKYLRVLKWEASKKEKRAKERLKTKKRKVEAKLNNIDLGPSRKQLKNRKMENSSCKTTVVIDLSFDELMINKVINESLCFFF